MTCHGASRAACSSWRRSSNGAPLRPSSPSSAACRAGRRSADSSLPTRAAANTRRAMIRRPCWPTSRFAAGAGAPARRRSVRSAAGGAISVAASARFDAAVSADMAFAARGVAVAGAGAGVGTAVTIGLLGASNGSCRRASAAGRSNFRSSVCSAAATIGRLVRTGPSNRLRTVQPAIAAANTAAMPRPARARRLRAR